ncbi:MAG: hypothetical protein N3A58_09145 [Spirochaetes bacterium]|nr:hypothetical protein [Spirochaetota bacterium]
MRKIIILILIAIFMFIKSSPQNLFSIYDIIEDFDLFIDGNFLVFNSIFKDKPERYFIYGYYPEIEKLVFFIRPTEFGRSRYFPDLEYKRFAYFSTYEGNDILWIKDVENEVGYRLVFNISGYIRKMHFSYDRNFVVMSFLYLEPTYYIYIAGIEEDYIYPVGFIPEIIEIFSNNNFVYILYKENYKYNLVKIIPLTKDEINQRKKVSIEYIFRDIKDLLFYNNKFILYKDGNKNILFNIFNEKTIEGENIKIVFKVNLDEILIKDNKSNKEKNSLLESDNNILIFNNFLIYKNLVVLINKHELEKVYKFNNFYIDYPYIIFDNRYFYYIDENKSQLYYLFDIDEHKKFIVDKIQNVDFSKLRFFCINMNDENLIFLVENQFSKGNKYSDYYLFNFNLKEKEFNKIESNSVHDFFKSVYVIKKIRNSKDFIYFLGYKRESLGLFSILFRIGKNDFKINTIYDLNYIDQKYLKYYLRRND